MSIDELVVELRNLAAYANDHPAEISVALWEFAARVEADEIDTDE